MLCTYFCLILLLFCCCLTFRDFADVKLCFTSNNGLMLMISVVSICFVLDSYQVRTRSCTSTDSRICSLNLNTSQKRKCMEPFCNSSARNDTPSIVCPPNVTCPNVTCPVDHIKLKLTGECCAKCYPNVTGKHDNEANSK